MRELLVEAQLQMTVGVVVVSLFQTPKVVANSAIRAGAKQNELAAVLEAVVNSMRNERHALLMIEAADISHDRLIDVLQPKALAQSPLVFILQVQGSEPVGAWDMAVCLRVPNIVIHAIQNAPDLVPVHMQ